MNDPHNHAEEIHKQLDTMLNHKLFRGAKRSCSFLRYVSDKVLLDECSQIKEFSIAVDAFGLETTFDQQIDPRIRVEAKRLRDRLSQYYEGPGLNDPVIIKMTRGSYIPEFFFNRGQESRPPKLQQNMPLTVLIDLRFNVELHFQTDFLPHSLEKKIKIFQSYLVHQLYENSRLEASSLDLMELVEKQKNAFSFLWEVRTHGLDDAVIQATRLILVPSGILVRDHQLELKNADLDTLENNRKAAGRVVEDLLDFCRRLKS